MILQNMMITIVFCRLVPEKVSRNAIPSTMPGMVLVTSATLSITFLHLDDILLLAGTSAAPYTTSDPSNAVSTAVTMEFLTTIESAVSSNTAVK